MQSEGVVEVQYTPVMRRIDDDDDEHVFVHMELSILTMILCGIKWYSHSRFKLQGGQRNIGRNRILYSA